MEPKVNISGETPSHLLTDYVEIAFLCLAFICGIAFNTYTLTQLLPAYWNRNAYKPNPQQRNNSITKSSCLLLKLNLNMANLLVLLTYCPAAVGWLSTYRWIGGVLLCKFVNFLWPFVFILCSNIVTAIAVDRLMNVLSMASFSTKGVGRLYEGGCLKKLLVVSWVGAAIFSAPQWFVWETIELEPNWLQCVTVWEVKHFNNYLTNGTSIRDREMLETVYIAAHLVTVFWLPFTIITFCYAVITLKLVQLSCAPYTSIPAEIGCADPDRRPTITGRLRRLTKWRAATSNDHTEASEPHNCVETSLVDHRTSRPSLIPPPVPGQSAAVVRMSHGQGPGPGPGYPRQHSRSVPNWRLQIRTKMFKTTAMVVGAYVVFWTPYNVSVLVGLFQTNESFQSELHWLKALILLNAVVNPFLYQFGRN